MDEVTVEIGSRPAARLLARLLALPVVAVFVFLREPSVFTSPRFWAEEGTNYFGSAVARGVVDGLLNIQAAPHNPYPHLVPHLATVAAAHWVPLELAPAVTTLAWAAVLLAYELVALFGEAEFLKVPWRRALAVALPLLAVSDAENWANTLGAHFYCDLALLLLLLEARCVAGRRRELGIGAFAGFAILSPTSWFLLPAAAFLAWKSPRAHRPYVAALGAAAVFEAIVSFAFFPSRLRTPPDLVYAPHIVVSKLLLWPVAGWRIATQYGEWVLRLDPDEMRAVAIGIFVGLVVLIGILVRFVKRDMTTFVLVVSYASSVAGYLFLGIGVGRAHIPLFNAGRYAWYPNALLILILANQIEFSVAEAKTRVPASERRWVDVQPAFRAMLAAVFAVVLVTAVREFRYPRPVVTFSQAPSWRAEVRHHREDPDYNLLHIAPDGWVVLVPQER